MKTILKNQTIKNNIFRATTADVDYLENQCAENPVGQANCDYQEYENQDIGFPDLQVTVVNKDEVWPKNHERYQSLNHFLSNQIS